MEWMLAYVVVLVGVPAVLLAVMGLLEKLGLTRRSEDQAAERPASQGKLSGGHIALEAQFLVAPGIAIEEARQMLSQTGAQEHRGSWLLVTPAARRACFDALLLELERVEKTAVSPARSLGRVRGARKLR